MIDFDAKIHETEQIIAEVTGRVERLKEQFIQSAGPALSQWYKTKAAELVQADAKLVLEMSPEQQSALKVAVIELANRADEIARQHLSDPTLWWNPSAKTDRMEYSYWSQGITTSSPIDRAYRRALGELGVIFDSFKLSVSTSQTRWTGRKNEWIERDGDSSPRFDAKPAFPNPINWPENLHQILKDYGAAVQRFVEATDGLARLQKAKAETEVKSIWDSL